MRKRECYASLSESLEAASLSSPASSGTASCGSSARLRFADDSEAPDDIVGGVVWRARRLKFYVVIGARKLCTGHVEGVEGL